VSRRSRGAHLPVSSSTSSASPRALSRSASRVSPSKRFHHGLPFRSYRCSSSPQGSQGFYVRAKHASLPPYASDMLTTRPGNWWCGDLHSADAQPVGCFNEIAIFRQQSFRDPQTPRVSLTCPTKQRNVRARAGPKHLALSHRRKAGRRRDGCSVQSRGRKTAPLCRFEVPV
jgi:hypothetical protein